MGTEYYAEGTPLVTLFSDRKRVKFLAVMLRDHERDLNASDISRMAGIERSTFYDHIDTLLDYGLVKITREVGNSGCTRSTRTAKPHRRSHSSSRHYSTPWMRTANRTVE